MIRTDAFLNNRHVRIKVHAAASMLLLGVDRAQLGGLVRSVFPGRTQPTLLLLLPLSPVPTCKLSCGSVVGLLPVHAELMFHQNLEPSEVLLPLKLLHEGACQQISRIKQLLASPAATAALASALASAVKYFMQQLQESAPLSAGAAGLYPGVAAAHKHFAAVVPYLLQVLVAVAGCASTAALQALVGKLKMARNAAAVTSDANITVVSSSLRLGLEAPCFFGAICGIMQLRSSATSSRPFSRHVQLQVAASCQLLLVLIARALPQLAGALDAGGEARSYPNKSAFFASSVLAQPNFTAPDISSAAVRPFKYGCEGSWDQHAGYLWQQCQLGFFNVFKVVFIGMDFVDHMVAAAAALAPAPASSSSICRAGSVAAASSSSSSSNSPQQGIKWSHLLQLPQQSRKLQQAQRAITEVWGPGLSRGDALKMIQQAPQSGGADTGLGCDLHQAVDVYFDSLLCYCRVLGDLAPLPVVCNSSSCSELHTAPLEAARAGKACARCGARFCGQCCFGDTWLRHKKACMRLAAAGLQVNGSAAVGVVEARCAALAADAAAAVTAGGCTVIHFSSS
jgi:hypothetical protein